MFYITSIYTVFKELLTMLLFIQVLVKRKTNNILTLIKIEKNRQQPV
jgi:hypothetical protein